MTLQYQRQEDSDKKENTTSNFKASLVSVHSFQRAAASLPVSRFRFFSSYFLFLSHCS